ncbi:MAG TPA: SH3 domain-containing C40 family peptidase [Salinimicrobium sp.]|nr:SH3 domain-containing C40 family peptidase [Salinimicrobium sp.]
MKNYRRYFIIPALLLLITGCEQEGEKTGKAPNEAESVIAQVREEYAPDSRVALFDIEAVSADEKFILKGESNLKEAVEELKSDLKEAELSFVDSIRILPDDAALEGKTQGVIEISVANLRSEPEHSSQLVTQATLGTPVEILKKDGSWFYVQTPDNYLAWTDYGGVIPLSDEEFNAWHSSAKLIYLEPFGFSYSEPDAESQVVSDLVAGNILELLGLKNGFFEVRYPNGDVAYIEQQEASPYLDWLNSLEQSPENFVEISKTMMGAPYLWGGTSTKGMDCSGFTKTIYFLNGVILPRDASQQVHTGVLVDTTKSFDNLLPGDLLFFGRPATDTTPERIIHVGMWIGDNKFIHSMGNVHVSTFDTASADFDEYNYNRYLKTKRLIGKEDERLIKLTQSELFIDKPE